MKVRLLVVVLLAFAAIPVVAQTIPCPPGTVGYSVEKGDTLWAKDGPTWERLLEPNSWLERRITRRALGRVIALIRPGETLCLPGGITSADVVKNGASAQVPTPVVAPSQAIVAPAVATAPAVVYPPPGFWSRVRDLWWLIVLLILVPLVTFLASRWGQRKQRELDQRTRVDEREEQRLRAVEAAAEARRRREEEVRVREIELTADPVTSAPPVVAGGIPATEPERLVNHFLGWAAAECARYYPGADVARIVRVSPIEGGMVSGEGMVGYADRARRRRINPPQPGYRATFRFPDGQEAVLMALVGCMNPCYYGEGLSCFTFTLGRVVVPAPEPTPAPAPVAPVVTEVAPVASATTAPAVSLVVPVVSTPASASAKRFISYAPVNVHGPAMLRWSGVNFHRIDVEQDGTYVIRFTPIE